MKIRAVAFLLLLTVPLCAKSHGHSANQADISQPGYAFALAAADHFLQAWQSGDFENGMVLLSDGLRQSQSADKLEQYFSDATNRAFEITRGRGHQGRYLFPVVLIAPRGSSHLTRKFSEIIVVDAGRNDWVVDKLP
ncbi:MAG: hypothetical protein WBW53_11040 [Terriglobales bacterium]